MAASIDRIIVRAGYSTRLLQNRKQVAFAPFVNDATGSQAVDGNASLNEPSAGFCEPLSESMLQHAIDMLCPAQRIG